MVLPGIGLERASRVGFAGDGDQLSARVSTGEMLGGNDELYLGALSPERLGKLVRKEQGIVAMTTGQCPHRGPGVGPLALDLRLVPLTQFKAVGACLQHKQMENLFLCHRKILGISKEERSARRRLIKLRI